MEEKKQKGKYYFIGMVVMCFLCMAVFYFYGLHDDTEDMKLFQASMNMFSMTVGLVLYYACLLDRDKISGLKLRFLRIVAVVYTGLCAEEAVLSMDGHPELATLNFALYTVVFLCNPVSAMCFFFYVAEYLDVKEKRIVRMMKWIIWVAFGAHCLVQLINCFIPLYFYFDEAGCYTRGDYYPFANTIAYLSGAFVIILLLVYKKRLKMYQFMILTVFFLVPLIVMAVNIAVRLSPIQSSLMCVLLVIYCVLNIEKTREQAAMETELSLANRIQAAMLPCVFPAFPERPEFELHASMNPAKEVGGDFYDFYMLDDDHLAIVMADVSGKGIPAALFMVVSKTVIKDQAQMMRQSPKAILEEVNNKLIKNNKEMMFVTVWLGILEISTGKIIAANAGHEYPAIRRGGRFELLKDEHGKFLGMLKNITLTEYEIKLEPGGCLFLYTDGVPEATEAEEEMFGTDRMIDALNIEPEAAPEKLLGNVRRSVDAFVGEAPQFDDLTMLALQYNGGGSDMENAGQKHYSKEFYADQEKLKEVSEFVFNILSGYECKEMMTDETDLIVEEIFVNISSYAYEEGAKEKPVWVDCDIDGNMFTMVFRDGGVRYNPLEKKDPETGDPKKMTIGGYGIFMVKNMADEMIYEYDEDKGQNVLTIKKRMV